MTFLTVARQQIAMQQMMQPRPKTMNPQPAPSRLRRQGFLETLVLGLALSVLALLVVPAILGGKNLPAQTHAPQATKPAQQQKADAKPAQPRRPAPGSDSRATTCLAGSNLARQPASQPGQGELGQPRPRNRSVQFQPQPDSASGRRRHGCQIGRTHPGSARLRQLRPRPGERRALEAPRRLRLQRAHDWRP